MICPTNQACGIIAPTPIASFYALLMPCDYVTAHLIKVEAYNTQQLDRLFDEFIRGEGGNAPLCEMALHPERLVKTLADNNLGLDDDQCIDLWLQHRQHHNRWHLWGDAYGMTRHRRINVAARVLLAQLGQHKHYVGNLLLVPAGLTELLGAEIAQEGQQ